MNRIARASIFALFLLVVLASFFVLYSMTFVFAGTTILNTSTGGASFQLNEDVNFVFNISINNTFDTSLNITQVNITFPGVFNFTAGTANASIATNFSNSSSVVLTFMNASGLATANASLFDFTTLRYFWFNASVHTPGNYNITVYTLYSNGTIVNTNFTNFTVVVNDTTFPSNITFVDPTPVNNSNRSSSSTTFNITVVELNIGAALLQIRTGGDATNITTNYTMNCNTIGGSNYACNYTNSSIADGRYNYTVFVNDTAGNLNRSALQGIVIETVFPSNITFVNPTPANASNQTATNIAFNVTVVEANIGTALLQIRTGGVDTSNYTMNCSTIGGSNYACNYTNSSIADGRYNYTVYINDTAGNLNNSGQQTVLVDNVAPVLTMNQPAATNLSTASANFNVTTNENTKYCNYSLSPGTTTYTTNYTMNNNGMRDFNDTNVSIADGTYTVKYYCFDYAANLNSSVTRTFGIDATFPSNITFVTLTPANASNQTSTSITFNVSVVEANIRTALLQIRTGGVDTSNYTMNCFTIGGSNYACNYTNSSLANGRYNYTVYVNDTAGNLNLSGIQTVLVDNVNPDLAYGGQVENPGANVSRTWIFVNVTVTEANFRNITFNLRNNTGTFNSTTYTATTFFVNFTGLTDGNYTYNTTIFDQAGNFNTTANRLITLDTVAPVITVNQPAATNLSTASVNFNVTTNENTQYCNYSLNSGTTNYTLSNNGMRDFNATNTTIANGTYTAAYYCWDYAVNFNTSVTRIFGINSSDVLTANLVSPATNSTMNTTTQTFSCNATLSLADNKALSALKLYIWYANGTQYVTNTSNVNGTANSTSWSQIIGTNGNYTWNCLANNTAQEATFSSLNRTFVMDTVAPTLPTHTCTPGSVTQGQAVACTCSGSTDATSGINSTYGSGGYSFTTSPNTATIGGFNVTCTVLDMAGNSNSTISGYNITTSGASAPPAGGGGGGGEQKEENTWTKITPGAATIMHVDDFGVKEITITVKNTANAVSISVVKVDGRPASITKSVEGKVYKYLEIRTTNLQSALEKATIRVKVEKAWVTRNNITKEKVAVYRYDTSSKLWQELSTKFANEDAANYYFDAETVQFSTFAIAEKPVAAPSPTPASTTTPPETTVPPAESSPTPQDGGAQPKRNLWIGLILALVVVVVIAGIIIFLNKKHGSLGKKSLKNKVWYHEAK